MTNKEYLTNYIKDFESYLEHHERRLAYFQYTKDKKQEHETINTICYLKQSIAEFKQQLAAE